MDMLWLMRVLCSAPLLALLLMGTHGDARGDAESSQRARQAHSLAREVMSPYCPGRTLADCPSPNAAALREEVRGLIDAGVPAPDIRARLEARFGDVVIGVPRGFWGWSLPGLMLFVGAGFLVTALRRISRQATGPEPRPPADPELEEELERELRARGL